MGKCGLLDYKNLKVMGIIDLTCSGQILEGFEKDCTGSQGPKWNVALEKEEKEKRKKKIKMSQSFHRVHIQRPPFSRINVPDEKKNVKFYAFRWTR